MASIVFHGRSNKRKNRVNSSKLFDLASFSITNRIMSGAFRDNIRSFVHNFGEIEDYRVSRMIVWRSSVLCQNDGVLPLYVMEETVDNSLTPFCDLCESSGWGHHFVCKRKYHLIIPEKNNWNTPLDEGFDVTHSHILYGLIHCNGYGHLICINALKNNSIFSTADDSMHLWDRLCTVLKVRYVSAHNFIKEKAIHRNLIYGAAYGKSWFEKWGYEFNAVKPGIGERRPNAAVRYLSSLSLDVIIIDSKKKRNSKRIQEMIGMYRKLSEHPLVTVGDLLKFMLVFQSRIRSDVSSGCRFDLETGDRAVMRYQTFLDSMTKDCRWPARRLENVLLVIVDLLKEHKAGSDGTQSGLSRQELRDEARKTIGDTGLIDFVLKSIKCFVLDDQIIRRAINPFSRLAEFTIHDISHGTGFGLNLNLTRDLQFLYENVLAGYSDTQVVLAANLFVKDWPIDGGEIENQSMKLTCKVLPSFDEMERELKRPLTPGEVVVVEPWITVADLKMVAQCALRDTYCLMDEFEVSQIGGLRKIEDEKMVCSAVGPGEQVWVRGRGLDLETTLRYEDRRWKS